MDNEPSAEQQWDAYTSGQPEAETETETTPTETFENDFSEDVAETEADEQQTADDGIDDLRAEIGALKQQFEQERLQYQEMLRRAQQSMRDTGNSIVERIEARLAQAQPALENLVRQQLITPEDAQAQLGLLERQYRREEIQRAQQQRDWDARQQWLQQQQPQAPTNGRVIDPETVRETQETLNEILERSGVTAEDLRNAGAPTDLSHLSPIQAIKTMQQWVVATARMKQALTGKVPSGSNGRRFPYPDMRGGAGIPARSMESITKELEAEYSKVDVDFDRVRELSAALDKYMTR